MKLRDWMNNNSAVVTILAVVVLVISLGVIIMNSSGRSGARIVDMYYYDMNSGKLFVGKSDQLAPIDAPSGPYRDQPGGVRAYVFACGECPDNIDGATLADLQSNGAFVGWMEMYTPEAKAALTQQQEGPPADMAFYEAFERGQLVKRPEDEQWVQAQSEPGFRITEQITTKCPSGEMPQPCFPGR